MENILGEIIDMKTDLNELEREPWVIEGNELVFLSFIIPHCLEEHEK